MNARGVSEGGALRLRLPVEGPFFGAGFEAELGLEEVGLALVLVTGSGCASVEGGRS